MAKAINSFINYLQNKGARVSNMWEVEFSTGYSDVDAKLKDVTMFTDDFKIPSREQVFGDVHFKGYPIPVPTHIKMEQEHKFKVRMDIENNTHKLFLKWLNYITDAAISSGSYFGGEKRVPKGSYMRVRMLAEDMKTVLTTYKIFGVSPSKVGDWNVKHDDPKVIEFEVDVKSVAWEIESTTGDFQEQK